MRSDDPQARVIAAGLIRNAIGGDAEATMETFARLDLADLPVVLLEATTFAAHAFLAANGYDCGRARLAADRVATRP